MAVPIKGVLQCQTKQTLSKAVISENSHGHSQFAVTCCKALIE